MTNMKWLNNIREGSLRVLGIFTWEMAIAAVITVLAISMTDVWVDKLQGELIKYISACLGLFFGLLGLRGISSERISFKTFLYAVFIWAFFAWLMIWYFKNTESPVIYVLISLIFGLIYPFFFSFRESFEGYVLKIVNALEITILYCAAIQIGIGMIFLALGILFGLNVEMAYIRTAIIVLTLLCPGIFFAYYPVKYEDIEKEKSKVREILFLYIALPLLSLYGLVIYIYFAKIMVNLKLPLNEVTWLIFAFLLIGFIGLVLLRGLSGIREDVFLKIQNAYLVAGTPLIILFAISLIERIGAFGFTEPRYMLFLFLIWICTVFIMILLKRTKQEMLAIAAVLAFISSGGFLGMGNVSNFSQEKRLTTIMDKYNVSSDGLRHDAIPDSDKREITEILKYFSQKFELDKLSHKIKTIDAHGKKVSYYAETIFYKNLELALAEKNSKPNSDQYISFYAEKPICLTQAEFKNLKAVIFVNDYSFSQKDLDRIPDEMKKYNIMTDTLLAEAVYDKKAQLYINGEKVDNLASISQFPNSSEIKIIMTYPSHENVYYLKSISGRGRDFLKKNSLRTAISIIQVKSFNSHNSPSDELKDVNNLNK